MCHVQYQQEKQSIMINFLTIQIYNQIVIYNNFKIQMELFLKMMFFNFVLIMHIDLILLDCSIALMKLDIQKHMIFRLIMFH